MKYRRKIFVLLTILWMVFIFFMSSQAKEDSNAQSGVVCRWICDTFVEDYDEMPPSQQRKLEKSISFPVRKGAHLTEYAVLGGLLLLSTQAAAHAALIGVLYAVIDEVHQLFVSGRAGQVRDVLIDTAGLAVGILVIHNILRSFKNRKKTRQ